VTKKKLQHLIYISMTAPEQILEYATGLAGFKNQMYAITSR